MALTAAHTAMASSGCRPWLVESVKRCTDVLHLTVVVDCSADELLQQRGLGGEHVTDVGRVRPQPCGPVLTGISRWRRVDECPLRDEPQQFVLIFHVVVEARQTHAEMLCDLAHGDVLGPYFQRRLDDRRPVDAGGAAAARGRRPMHPRFRRGRRAHRARDAVGARGCYWGGRSRPSGLSTLLFTPGCALATCQSGAGQAVPPTVRQADHSRHHLVVTLRPAQ